MALLRSFAVVGLNTLGSRVLGFVRDILIARVLGTGAAADAWVIAFRLPNLFRRLFSDGAINAALVPLLTRELDARGPAAARRLTEEVLAVLLAALLALTVLAEAAMPLVVRALAPGFGRDSEAFALALELSRITFPYLIFMTLVALFASVLNAHRRFALASAAPMILNAALIAAVTAGLAFVEQPAIALAVGVAVAGVLQAGLLFVGVVRLGYRLEWLRPRLTPAVRQTLKLAVPGLIAGGVTQINSVVGTMIASAEAGAPAVLYYADRVYQLPLGLVGVAIGVVLLPELARNVRAGERDLARRSLSRALELALLLTLPAAAALMVIPAPIAGVLFERGAFGSDDVRRTAEALIAFGLGLPAFVLIKVFQPGFFAREDTVTPVRVSALAMAANVVLSLGLFFGAGLGATGIALATSLAAWIDAILLAAGLTRAGHFSLDPRLKSRAPRIVLATLVMAGALLAGRLLWPHHGSALSQAMALAVLVIGGGLIYAAACLGLGAARLGDLGPSLAPLRAGAPDDKPRRASSPPEASS